MWSHNDRNNSGRTSSIQQAHDDECDKLLPDDNNCDENHVEFLAVKDRDLSNNQALVSLIKGLVGTGILSLPLAFHHAGLLTGMLLTIAIAVVNIDCMHMLVRCSRSLCSKFGKSGLDYADVAELCVASGPTSYQRFSSLARFVVNSFLFATQLGFCCVYFVFMADNIKQVTDHYGFAVSQHTYIAILLLPVFLLCLIKDLKLLSPFAIAANVIYVVGLVITFQYMFQDLEPITRLPLFNSWSTLPLFFGSVMFSFEGICLVLPIENRMANPSDFGRWNGVMNTGCVIVVCLYMAVAFFGYLRFGADVKDSITLNLPNEPLYHSVKIMLAVAMWITYAIQFYVPINIVSNFIHRSFDKHAISIRKNVQLPKAVVLDFLARLLLVLFTFTLAELIPHLGLFISLVGSLTSAALAMIFPPIIELLTFGVASFGCCRWRMWKNLLICFCGLLGFSTGTYSAIRDIITKSSS